MGELRARESLEERWQKLNKTSQSSESARETLGEAWNTVISAVQSVYSSNLAYELEKATPREEALRSTQFGSVKELIDGAFEKIKDPKYIRLFNAMGKAESNDERDSLRDRAVRGLMEDLQIPEDSRKPEGGITFPVMLAVLAVDGAPKVAKKMDEVYNAFACLRDADANVRELQQRLMSVGRRSGVRYGVNIAA